jgi:hypothetical protein
MFCTRHKSLIALVALILVTAVLLNPGVASARPNRMASSPAVLTGNFLDMLWSWIMKAGWGMDPNGDSGVNARNAMDAGWGMDPNGGA